MSIEELQQDLNGLQVALNQLLAERGQKAIELQQLDEAISGQRGAMIYVQRKLHAMNGNGANHTDG